MRYEKEEKKKEEKNFLVFEWVRGYKSGQSKLLINELKISVVYNENLLITHTKAKTDF